MNLRRVAVATTLGSLLACRPAAPTPAPTPPTVPPAATPEPPRPVISLLGETLAPIELDDDVRRTRRQAWEAAEQTWTDDPEDVDATIWFGRRTAYLGRYHEAIDIYTEGLAVHPDDARLLRHRGHRYITVREFEAAIADLQRAASFMLDAPDRVEEDGLPNAAGVPTGSLYTNVWYHLALAHYLTGDYGRAAEAWEACLDAARTDDMRVAASYWRAVASLRRGELDEATAIATGIGDDLRLYENFAYQHLLDLFAGRRTLDDFELETASDLEQATYGYGIGAWHHGHGRPTDARAAWDAVLRTPQWASFGYIAAEVEVARAGARTD